MQIQLNNQIIPAVEVALSQPSKECQSEIVSEGLTMLWTTVKSFRIQPDNLLEQVLLLPLLSSGEIKARDADSAHGIAATLFTPNWAFEAFRSLVIKLD